MIVLGDRVRDTLTGFEGTVTALVSYLHNPISLAGVTSCHLHEGKEVLQWFNEERLLLLNKEPPVIPQPKPNPR